MRNQSSPDSTPAPVAPGGAGNGGDKGRYGTLLAWFFVIVWGSGFLASKTGMLYAPPFTFLTLRYLFALACMVPLVLLSVRRWPGSMREVGHLCVAGLLMHAINLSGSHYSQYLGMSAGNTALILALQPLLTAVFAQWRMGERLNGVHWAGILMGLGGVALVVWPKLNLQAMAIGSLASVMISLLSITAGTLYQRVYCPQVDLRVAALIQFAACLLFVAPLAYLVEGFVIDWSWQLVLSVIFLVVFASILATNVFHIMMRRGQATRVTSLLFLTPVVAVLLEWVMFGVTPTWLMALGIAVTCAGVALVSMRSMRG
ncbi:DMT family transporter [Lacisediminimonas sp.]|uniref:DMT family transporter n=1 Tax=Lacisediminimonas sp. TaxID=3060582 RepID=UPI002720E62C|nr:DMT family transporter [Lacisediminimonas sp.]MDO8299577.1 DMT family transporter [Lacisediminimonas sp.]MDO9216987.1 DMT family transporter [Lacisediminimonas sp.]